MIDRQKQEKFMRYGLYINMTCFQSKNDMAKMINHTSHLHRGLITFIGQYFIWANVQISTFLTLDDCSTNQRT
jgi:hypothetical protein